jgi:hypothetical protein
MKIRCWVILGSPGLLDLPLPHTSYAGDRAHIPAASDHQPGTWISVSINGVRTLLMCADIHADVIGE